MNANLTGKDSKDIKFHKENPIHAFKLGIFPKNFLCLYEYQVYSKLFYCLLLWPERFEHCGFSIFYFPATHPQLAFEFKFNMKYVPFRQSISFEDFTATYPELESCLCDSKELQ